MLALLANVGRSPRLILKPVGPDGLYVGPSDSELVGPDGPYVGPVGPSDSEPVGPDGPYMLALLARLTLNQLAQMACMLACVGRCPHLTWNLLAQIGPNVGPVGPVWDAVPL